MVFYPISVRVVAEFGILNKFAMVFTNACWENIRFICDHQLQEGVSS